MPFLPTRRSIDSGSGSLYNVCHISEVLTTMPAAAPVRHLFPALGCLWFALMFAPLFSTTAVPYFRDHTNQFLAYRHLLATAPSCWHDVQYLGTPLFADP